MMDASLTSARQPDLALVVRLLPRPVPRTGSELLIPYLQSEDNFPYEQDIQRNPGSTKPWLAYIEYKLQHGTLREQAFVMERACIQLPRSYKLWKMVGFAVARLQESPS
jgi:pre-mRNA-splicing factor SYF1